MRRSISDPFFLNRSLSWFARFVFFAGLAFITSAVLFSIGTSPTAFADDDKKSDKKDDKKKLEMPKLPEGSKPKWDFESVEEKFTIIKGNIDDDECFYLLLELKEDMASTSNYSVIFTDSEGIKFAKGTAFCMPAKGKKGDRIRLTCVNYSLKIKDTWVKAVKVQIVEN